MPYDSENYVQQQTLLLIMVTFLELPVENEGEMLSILFPWSYENTPIANVEMIILLRNQQSCMCIKLWILLVLLWSFRPVSACPSTERVQLSLKKKKKLLTYASQGFLWVPTFSLGPRGGVGGRGMELFYTNVILSYLSIKVKEPGTSASLAKGT